MTSSAFPSLQSAISPSRKRRALPREDTAKLPIIALPANSREEDRCKSLESGMNNHIAKPIDIEYLTQTIRRTIAAQRKVGTETVY